MTFLSHIGEGHQEPLVEFIMNDPIGFASGVCLLE